MQRWTSRIGVLAVAVSLAASQAVGCHSTGVAGTGGKNASGGAGGTSTGGKGGAGGSCPGVDLTTDPANCGACGHVCGPTALAFNQPNPVALTIDSTSVYWANAGTGNKDGAIMKLPINGGVPFTVVSGLDRPSALAVDSTSVYWIAHQVLPSMEWINVMKEPIGGGQSIALAVTGCSGRAMAVDSTSVYWIDNCHYPGPSVMKAPPPSGAFITLGPG